MPSEGGLFLETHMSLVRTTSLFLLAAISTVVVIWSARSLAQPTPRPKDAQDSNSMNTANTAANPAAAPKGPAYSKSAYDITPLSQARIDELAKQLSPADAEVILAKGTERPFCGTLLDNKKEGTYVCKLCGLPLFSSDSKFNSGTGWPSFFKPYDDDHVAEIVDKSHGMGRTEILCTRCSAHLGHVFDDGPRPTGLRFCLNSASLEFVEKGTEFPPESRPVKTETAYFAGGCFWGVEDRFQQTSGVITAVSGYQGGKTEKPTYKQICTGTTDHAETVKVVFDPARITYRQLLERFFKYHNPTTMNRQGPDIGTQYRSAIFTADEAQQKAAAAYITELQGTEKFKGRTIVTQVVPVAKAGPFYEAEDYHQDYHAKHGGSCALPEE
jgi:peptide methionine sulfoxide reductase msrA/msrB